MSRELTFAEYFAGIGLVRLGLQGHGWYPLFANDIEPKKHSLYTRNFPGSDGLYVVDDIHRLEPDQIPLTVLATACFPCVDLSIAGNRRGLSGRQSGAFWGFVRILEAKNRDRPPLVLLENVTGWLTSNRGRDFPEAIAALNSLGYVCDAFVLNAQHFTPQSRPRLFVVGARHRYRERSYLESLESRSPYLRTNRLLEAVSRNAGCRWMSLDLPSPPAPRNDLARVVQRLPEGDERWWPARKVDHLVSQMSRSHWQVVAHLMSRGEWSYATVYKRVRKGGTRAEVRADGVAGCLRTPVGGSSKQIVIAAGNGVLRARWMTAREYARLQGVPDTYVIDVPYLQALWGFGDAVCVPALSWVAEHALNPLAQEL